MGHKLLIIDDNEGDIKLIQEMLMDSGIVFDATLVAQTAEEGLKNVMKFRPTIALIDTQLPGINGFETCKRIKEMLHTDVKVIIVTGVIDAIDAVKAREMGADEYCVKTSEYASLKRCIQSFMT
jgi:DNA-binding response OmpR family regulator